MRRLAALLATVLVLGACGGSDNPSKKPADGKPGRPSPIPTPTVPGSPEFGIGTALLDGKDGPVLISIEVAENDEQRGFGLMFREEIPDDYGMAFLYFDPQTCCFYMKNTLVPLSVAFFDEEGHIKKILDMEPCEKDPCPTYDPGVSYWGALEVNKGAFDEWGVTVGDTIRMN